MVVEADTNNLRPHNSWATPEDVNVMADLTLTANAANVWQHKVTAFHNYKTPTDIYNLS